MGFTPIKIINPGVFFIRVRPKILVFYIRVFDLILGGSFEISYFWQYFNWVIKGHLMDFEIEKNVFFIQALNLLLLGSALVP